MIRLALVAVAVMFGLALIGAQVLSAMVEGWGF